MPTLYAKRSYAGSRSAVDLGATSQWLYERLLAKEPNDDDDVGLRKGSRQPGSVTPGAAYGNDPGVSTPATGRESVAASGVGRIPSSMGSAAGHADRSAVWAMLSPAELERERADFMEKHTTDSTRVDVQVWVDKVFNMKVRQSAREMEQNASKFDKRRRARSTGGTSDSSASGMTLAAAGASMATVSHKAPSLISAESLVVHHGQGADILNGAERLRAYMSGEIPDLKQYVDKCLAAKVDEVCRRIDGEYADHFLKATADRTIFGPQCNYLRWQGTRRAKIDRVLEENMQRWIWEAALSWEQPKASEAKDVSDVDLIYDYLTKRAAHIDTQKMETEIPIFKTFHASYSLPHMWRDKYI